MKRMLNFISAMAVMSMLLLSSCGDKDVKDESGSGDMTAESISGEISSPPEEKTEETTADTSGTEAAVLSENKIADGVFLPPDEDFLRSIYSDDGTLLFTLDSSGKYSVCDDDSLYDKYEDQRKHEYVKEMLSEEYYEEIKEYFEDEVSSYEEYRTMMEEYLGDELNGYQDYEPEETEPLVYFAVELYSYTDEDKTAAYSDEQILIRSVCRLVERINEDPEIAKMITNCFENGGDIYAVARVEYDGNDVITISSYFTESLIDSFYGGETEFFLMEDISADGREGIVLNGTFVPADTERLFITSFDQIDAEILADEIIPEDCLMVCCEDLSDSYYTTYDLKDVAEKLPKLRELYIYHAKVSGTEYIAQMQGLETLCYCAIVPIDDENNGIAADTPFKDLPKLKKLWLYGDYADYSFLNEMPGLEDAFVSIDTWRKAEKCPYDSVFDCPAVTGFEIEINNDLTGLEKLTNLKHLHLTYGWVHMGDDTEPIDISVVKELKNLTCLEISASGFDIGELSGSIGEPSKLENLELVRVKTTKDWSFLSELTSLKSMYLFDIPYISAKDIEQMPWLEKLRYYQTDIDSSIYDRMPGLKKE